MIETVSFALVALLGLSVTWRKAGRLAGRTDPACAPGCGHVHLNDAAALARLDSWRERAGVSTGSALGAGGRRTRSATGARKRRLRV